MSIKEKSIYGKKLKQVRKINNALFNSLNSNISDPFIVIDHNGEILSLNKNAEVLFSIKSPSKNIFDLFTDQSIGRLSDLIEKVFTGNNPVSENVHLDLKSGAEFNAFVIINSYSEENEVFIFCTFRKQEFKLDIREVTNIKVETLKPQDIISDKLLIEIIEQIKSLYPFTFIGKEKITKEINKLEEMFWLKDNNDIYVLANNKLAENLGVKPFQIEGKPAKSFLPAYLVEFYNSIEKYIIGTLNCIVLEGFPFAGIADPKKYQTIEIPLSDSDNNVIALVGIAQPKEKSTANHSDKDLNVQFYNLLDNFPKAVAVFDNEGIIQHQSKEFSKLFLSEISDFRNFNYGQIFSFSIIEKIRQFLDQQSASEKFEIEIQNNLNKTGIGKQEITLNKISDNNGEPKGFAVLIENIKTEENLENIINSRGRMFEILIENNPEPMFIYYTENLRFIEVNNAALNLYGYRKDEFLQMDLTDLYTPEDIQTLLDSSKLAARVGKFSGPYKHKKKDGSYIFVELSKINFKYKEKDAHFNIIRDVTHNLELETKNQLFRIAFDNTDDLLFVTDNIGLITFVNPSVKKILGYSKEEIENSSFNALVKNDDRGTVNSSVFQSYLKEAVTISTELKKQNGEFISVELTAYPVMNYKGEVEEFSIICKPEKTPHVTEKVKEVIKEVYIQQPNPAVEPQIEQQEFSILPNLFHEILTPINVILGFVQEIADSITVPTQDQKEAVDIINQNRSRLLNIMNSIIEYSSIKENNYELKPEEISITEVIDQLHNEFKEIPSAKNIEFAYGKISSSLKFNSDKQKFQNLVSLVMRTVIQLNKEKKIYFSAYQNDDGTFIISCKDNYSGVSKYLLDSLKAIFEQENDAVSKNYGISKLTLRLIRNLLSILKGKFQVFIQSNEKMDYGFLFPIDITSLVKEEEPEEVIPEETKLNTMDFEQVKENSMEDLKDDFEPIEAKITEESAPLNFEEKESNNLEDTQPPVNVKLTASTNERLNISSLSCLYIEDQVDSQILFKVQMKELKEIKFAVSFEEALPLLDSDHFDFIVMDINLQGEYNGLDALKIIHKMPNYENIPIIAVTAYVLPGDKEKFIATGFTDFISKPIFREKMMDSLDRIFTLQM